MSAKLRNPIDVHVGSRVRLQRHVLGMSQAKLGTAVGISFQQIQKYEPGADRVGAGRLQAIARILDVPVSSFFDETDGHVPSLTSIGAGREAGCLVSFIATREGLALNRAFVKIIDAQARKKVIALVKAIANDDVGLEAEIAATDTHHIPHTVN